MPDKPLSFKSAASVLLAVLLIPVDAAVAFPFLDAGNQDNAATGAPLGTDLPATDAAGLQNQLRLLNPAAAGNHGPWTIVPRITAQEEFTDNALEVTSPRRFDAVTVLSPGISILADTSRLQMNLDYQPSLFVHAIDGPLNVVTQQLNGTGTVTVVPNFAFVDIRAVSGVQSRLGALAGTGTLGNPGATAGTAGGIGTTGGIGIGNGQGLNSQNEVQTSSLAISPYLLKQFGDYGTGKVGVSAAVSRYASIGGFASPPIPIGGTNGQSLLTTEQIAQFTTGQALGKIQDTVSVDISQSSSKADGVAGAPAVNTRSQRETFNNQVSYALNRTFTLLASIGEQNIVYSPAIAQQINGLTWNAGITFTPTPDSGATVTYGHINGSDSFTANGHIALTARTLLSFDYSNTVGTQLENLQGQLNASTIGINGQSINAQTGGPSFVAQNGLGVQTGVFRFNTFNVSVVTGWLRDTLQIAATWSIQTNLNSTPSQTLVSVDASGLPTFITLPGGSTGQSTDYKTGSVSWVHSLSPDMTLNSSATLGLITRSGSGTDTTLSTSVSWQYAMSAATTVSASYTFFDRSSKIPGYGLYENLLLLGITKKF
jgi:uncharacterized protein (PEP-CTERM system associated)